MFNLSETVAALRDAATIVASPLLDEAEKGVLLGELVATIPPSFNRPYIDIITAALERTYEPYRPAPARPTPREQNPTPVAKGAGEATAEAPEGPTERLPEQAENAGGVADASDSDRTTAEAPAPTEKPKQGKARK